ncbi:hypothetical protein [Clostridium algidicarnis]|uniref:hypothetical protein n=1 Tax=Clostridium algidicarnis TaxID=37659 RepID=UPI003FD8D213
MKNKLIYNGEKIKQGGNYPALTKFIKGNPKEALTVFVPGAAHLARIAYGGHNGSQDEDFLAHWLVSEGYNFLGISYPIATKLPIYNESYPNFTIRAWGKQVAEIAKTIIDENNLSKHIILIVWSNGGRIVQSFYEYALTLGLDVDFCTSFSATPPNMAVVKFPSQVPNIDKMDKYRYSDCSKSFDRWYNQININSHINCKNEIIPKDVYYNEYIGSMPVNLKGTGTKYHNGEFVASELEFIGDSKSYDYANFPLMTTIVTDNIIDSRHALSDQSIWGAYLISKIYCDYIEKNKMKIIFNKLSAESWKSFVELVRTSPIELSMETQGNHFFFVGESGAHYAALCVKKLERKVKLFKTNIEDILKTTLLP